MLPMIVRIKITGETNSFGFFIPMIFVYLLLLPAYLICAIVYACMCLAPDATVTARAYLNIVLRSPLIFAAARGTEVAVQSNDSNVLLYIQ